MSSYLELVAIRSLSPGGPRYDPEALTGPGTANWLILCPNHHRLADAEPHRYTVELLQRMRAEQLQRGRSASGDHIGPQQQDARHSGLEGALEVWDGLCEPASEEFWHRLFENVPELLAVAVPGDAVLYGSKCYVGGKNLHNAGGTIVDFLYVSRRTANATLVEIKTPQALLIGSAYRGVFTPSTELAGSVMQAIGYRDEIQKSFYTLSHATSSALEVFNPRALVVIGNLDAEKLDAARRRSFDLFRYGLCNVIVITFDELFEKVRDLVGVLRANG